MPSIPAIITVDYEELEGSPTMRYNAETGELVGERELQCAWADVWDLLAQLMGDVEGSDPTTGQGLVVVEPHRFPWNTALLARSGEVSGFGQCTLDASLPQKGNQYTKGRVRVQYRSGGFGGPFGDPTQAEESIEPAVRFLTAGGRELFWDDGGEDPVDTNEELPGIMVRSFDYVVRMPRMPQIPSAAYALLGAVNDEVVEVPRLGFEFPEETLLYQITGLSRVATASGGGAWKAEFRLSYQPGGWNEFYRSSKLTTSGALDPSPIYSAPTVNSSGAVTAAGEPVKFYRPADFGPIMELFS
jgi:hypothetical protein